MREYKTPDHVMVNGGVRYQPKYTDTHLRRTAPWVRVAHIVVNFVI